MTESRSCRGSTRWEGTERKSKGARAGTQNTVAEVRPAGRVLKDLEQSPALWKFPGYRGSTRWEGTERQSKGARAGTQNSCRGSTRWEGTESVSVQTDAIGS